MTKDKGAPILTKRITADTEQELDEKFRAWTNEWRHKIEMLDQRWGGLKQRPHWVEIDYYLIPSMLVRILPFKTVQTEFGEEKEGEVALWQSGENMCEYTSDENGGVCDNSGLYYGTPAAHEPKFCARHFYRNVVFGEDKQGRLIVG